MTLLDRTEAAERLHVSVMTVRRLGRDGSLDEVRVSKRAIRITEDSVVRHIAAGHLTEVRRNAAP